MKILENTVLCTLTAADPAAALFALSALGIRTTDIQWEDDLTLRFRCAGAHKQKIVTMCRKRGDEVQFSQEQGWGKWLSDISRRPVITAGFLFFLAMTLILPTRVFFFRVEGNSRIPQRQILEAAERCGIRFGVSRKEVRSEKMKNALLSAMPELKWAGINTAGCTGVISVRERMPEPEQKVSPGVSSIAACRDGFITSCTVTRGNALCAPGQVVRKGQVLISGFTDCGICIRATEAQGEIFAQTRHDLTLKTPSEFSVRLSQKEVCRRYGLILGKKRINLWKGSGISDPTCGRMYEEYYITLPGGFRLPVCVFRESLTSWQISAESLNPEELDADMKAQARSAVLKNTVAGQILHEEQVLSQGETGFVLISRFLCEEMIGRVITEEIGETNGKTD